MKIIKIFITFIVLTLITSLTYGYSAFTAKATITGQVFTTEKQLTKDELISEVETTFVESSEDFENLLDSSLEFLVDKQSLNEALAGSDLKIVSLQKISEVREKEESWAEVDYLVTYNNNSTAKFTAILHFEYGTWKLFGTVPLE
ncbi:MAG: hypothetical protein O2871_01520 [bacterium]|nr:hypothetical protein [bacterium]